MINEVGSASPRSICDVLGGDELGWVEGTRGHAVVAVELWGQGRVVFSLVARAGRWAVAETATRLRGTATIKPAEWRRLRDLAVSHAGPPPKVRERTMVFHRVPDFPGLGAGVFPAALRAFDDAKQGSEPSSEALALLAAAYVEATTLGRGQSSALIQELADLSGSSEQRWRRYMTRAGERGVWDRQRSSLTPLGEQLVEDYWAALVAGDDEHLRSSEREAARRDAHPCLVSILPGAPARIARL